MQPFEESLMDLYRAFGQRESFIAGLPFDLRSELVRFNVYNEWLNPNFEIKPAHKVPHEREVTAVTLIPENGTFITLMEHGAFIEYSLRTGNKLRDGKIVPLMESQPGGQHDRENDSIWSIEKVGPYLFLSSQFGVIYKVDYESFLQLDHGKKVADGYVKVRSSMGRLVYASYNSLVVCDPHTMTPIKKVPEIPYAPAALMTKDRYLVCDMWETPERKKNSLFLYDAATFAVIRKFEAPLTIFSTEISPPWICAGLQDGDVLVWNMETGEKVRTLKAHRKLVYALHSLGNILLTGSNDFDLAFWNLDQGELVRHQKQQHTGWVNSVKITPQGTVITGSEDKSVVVWGLQRVLSQQIDDETEDEGDSMAICH
jgi:hypothetical protein